MKFSPGVRIFFEDADILVVDKPAGLLTVPTEKKEPKTLFGILKKYLLVKFRDRAFTQPVQRLDFGTSGVMVWPKTETAWNNLREQFEKHTVQRTYIGIVKGQLEVKAATIKNYLKTDRTFTQIVSTHAADGQEAITHYRTLADGGDFSIACFSLETGRKNQIRAQMAHLGHPILGDDRYQPKLSRHPLWKGKRLALHAARVEFQHPRTHKTLKFQSRLPKDFVDFTS